MFKKTTATVIAGLTLLCGNLAQAEEVDVMRSDEGGSLMSFEGNTFIFGGTSGNYHFELGDNNSDGGIGKGFGGDVVFYKTFVTPGPRTSDPCLGEGLSLSLDNSGEKLRFVNGIAPGDRGSEGILTEKLGEELGNEVISVQLVESSGPRTSDPCLAEQ
ncbi:hypothetical protein ABID29_001531 [Streptococcus rupicaprae]|uniref:Uncharacterized protein n=1 Tax=Streptococcus rupicaprae TaxID=759619 RepID=A0ABV2FIP2_9STRE